MKKNTVVVAVVRNSHSHRVSAKTSEDSLNEQSGAARNEIPAEEEEGDSNGLAEAGKKTTESGGAQLTQIICHNGSFKHLLAGKAEGETAGPRAHSRPAVHRSRSS